MGAIRGGNPGPALIPVSCPDISDLERAYVADAMASGWIAGGPYVERFERAFADWQGYRHCVSVCNGTVALHLALVAMGIGPGDEVLVPTLTYAATAAAVVHAGAAPVFVDSGPDGTMDAALAAEAITGRTRLILPVHLYGRRAELEALGDLGVPLLVDAAEGHGIANAGHPATYSFFANKIIACGEGGAVCTDSPDLADRLRHLRDQAMTWRWMHDAAGYNYRMSNLHAAIGCAQVERADRMVATRRALLDRYGRSLPIWAASAPWLANLHTPGPDRLEAALGARGIESRPCFFPLHRMPPYAGLRHVGGRTAGLIAAQTLSLPLSSTMSVQDVDRVIGAVTDEDRRCAR